MGTFSLADVLLRLQNLSQSWNVFPVSPNVSVKMMEDGSLSVWEQRIKVDLGNKGLCWWGYGLWYPDRLCRRTTGSTSVIGIPKLPFSMSPEKLSTWRIPMSNCGNLIRLDSLMMSHFYLMISFQSCSLFAVPTCSMGLLMAGVIVGVFGVILTGSRETGLPSIPAEGL